MTKKELKELNAFWVGKTVSISTLTNSGLQFNGYNHDIGIVKSISDNHVEIEIIAEPDEKDPNTHYVGKRVMFNRNCYTFCTICEEK